MYATSTNVSIDRWGNRRRATGFYENDFHLAKFFDADADEIEGQLEKQHKYSKYLNLLREDSFSEFTLISPFLPESLMLNFYAKVSNKLHLYYLLGNEVRSVNLVDEFSDECNELASLYMAGCLSCTNNHNCVPFLSDNQVDYGFRMDAKKIDAVVRKLADSTNLHYAPRASHSRIYEVAYRLLNYSFSSSGGFPRSTEQLLLTEALEGKNRVSEGIENYLNYKDRKVRIDKFRATECARCILKPSCDALYINKAKTHSRKDISKSCKGAVTDEDYGLDATLLEIATNLFLYSSNNALDIASEFTGYMYDEFTNIELTPAVKKAMGILRANSKFFYGAMVLPTTMVNFMHWSMDSEASRTIFFDWGRNLNRGMFVSEATSRVHIGVGGLEKFQNLGSSDWSILLPTHQYVYFGAEREFVKTSNTPWFVAITAEEFMLSYGDLTSSRVISTSWMRDFNTRVLYLVKAFLDITVPRTLLHSGSFGVNRSLMPGANNHITMPSNRHLTKLSKSTNISDALTEYINTFTTLAAKVSWPRSVVVNAFPIDEE